MGHEHLGERDHLSKTCSYVTGYHYKHMYNDNNTMMDPNCNHVISCIMCENTILATTADVVELRNMFANKNTVPFVYRSTYCKRCRNKVMSEYGPNYINESVVGYMCTKNRPSFVRAKQSFRYEPLLMGNPFHIIENIDRVMNEVKNSSKIYHITVNEISCMSEYTDMAFY